MNLKYTIRPVAHEDFGRINELYIEMLSSIYGGGCFSDYEDGYPDKFLPENGCGVIFTADTDNGIGSALLRTAEGNAASVNLYNTVLHAERSNKGAIRLYEKSVFVEFSGGEPDSRIRMIKKSRR